MTLSDKALQVHKAMTALQSRQLGPTLDEIGAVVGLERGSVLFQVRRLLEEGLVEDVGTESHKYVAIVESAEEKPTEESPSE